MPKYLFILALFSIMGLAVNAQKVVFDLNVGMNFSPPDGYARSYADEWYSYAPLNDSTVIRTQSEFIIENKQEYTPDIGFEANGLFSIKLSNRFSLNTGIGLNYFSYKVGTLSQGYFGGTIKVDTISYYPIIVFPGPNACDCYENSYADVSADFDRRIHMEMINLTIPAEIGYTIIPHKLEIRAGMFMQTPLYAASKREFIDIERMTMDDTTKCKYIRALEKNEGTIGISNFQCGVSARIAYEIFPNLRLEVGIRKLVNDMYVKEEYQLYSNDNNSFKPLTFSAGLSYRLYNGAPEN